MKSTRGSDLRNIQMIDVSFMSTRIRTAVEQTTTQARSSSMATSKVVFLRNLIRGYCFRCLEAPEQIS